MHKIGNTNSALVLRKPHNPNPHKVFLPLVKDEKYARNAIAAFNSENAKPEEAALD